MSVTGIVKNGVIVLPAGTTLPDGTEVRVETVSDSDPAVPSSYAAAVKRLAKARSHLPADYALNHGHYRRGEPKK
jgi:hypothetical protein